MRRFRLLKTEGTTWTKEVKVGKIYPEDYFVTETEHIRIVPSDFWEEIFDEILITDGPVTFTPNTKPLHKDTDLGYYAGLAMQGLLSNSKIDLNKTDITGISILHAKELIKQLDQEKK